MKLLVLLIITTICGLSEASSMCAIVKKDLKNTSVIHQTKGTNSSTNRIHFQIPMDDDIKSEECNNYCFTLWKEEKTTNGSSISIILQGCWKQSGEQKCENTECIAGEQSRALNNTKFCCCTGDYCNLNIKDYSHNKSMHSSPTISTQYLGESDFETWMLITVVTLFSIFIIIIIIILLHRIYCRKNLLPSEKPTPYTDQFTESAVLKSGVNNFEHLKLLDKVGEGRYGAVWKAMLADQVVAAKVYPAHFITYFQNERETYCLPFMDHPSLLHYFGSQEIKTPKGDIEHRLILSYAPRTLRDFLYKETIDWPTFCKMGLTIVKGLAYLHTEQCNEGKVKPCVAHRDINSSNILIKADGTCCICDLGLAVHVSGSKNYSKDEEQRAETKSTNDFSKQVGTLRYMAPEILEGAVNLRDCESSLKQIDVYAMGLVLWELASRCSDIYVPGTEVPPYAQPFEREIKPHPTFEDMQICVSRNKLRPKLQGNVIRGVKHIRFIKETMEDCWDADAEARLTALCIQERLTELQSNQVALYISNENLKMNSNSGYVPSSTNIVQINETGVQNLVHLSSSNSTTDDQSSTSSNEKPIYKPSESLESINSTQLSSFNEQSTRSDSYHRDYVPSSLMVASIASTSKQSLDDESYPSAPEYQTLVNPESPIYDPSLIPGVYVRCNDSHPSDGANRKHGGDFLRGSPRKRKFAGWSQIKNILSVKKPYSYSHRQIERDDSKSSLLGTPNVNAKIVDTNVTISGGKYVNGVIERSLPGDRNANYPRNENERPSTLPLVPLDQTKKATKTVSRQVSLDKFNEVFNVDSNLRDLKDPHMRIKTPGDLPPSVRKMRGRSQSTARFSLYDDRIMCNIFNEEDDCAGKNISSSVPFGMDFAECKPATFDSNVTCF